MEFFKMYIFKYFVCTMFSKSLWNRRTFFYSQMTSLENIELPNKRTCLLNFLGKILYICLFRSAQVQSSSKNLNLNWDNFLV